MNDIKVNSFIKTDGVIYSLLTNQGFQDYGNTAIDVYCWILNDLAATMEHEGNIMNKHSATFTKADTSKMIKHDTIKDTTKRTSDLKNSSIKKVKDIVFNTNFSIHLVTKDKDKETLFFLFSYVGYDWKTEELTVGYNPLFLEHFKQICEQQSFNRLQVDIMTSLTTLPTKYVWMYISQYTKQLHMNGNTNWTNIDTEDSLPMLIAGLKKGQQMRIANVVQTIETALTNINNLILFKNELYGLNSPTYAIEWSREQDRISKTGKNRGKYSQYRIIEVKCNNKSEITPKQEDKPKKKTQTCKEMYELVEAALDGEDVTLNYKVITGWFLHMYDLETGHGHGGQFPTNIGKIKNIAKQFHLEDNFIGLAKHMEDYIVKYKKAFTGFPVLADFTTAWKVKEVMGGGSKKMSYNNAGGDYVPNTKGRRH